MLMLDRQNKVLDYVRKNNVATVSELAHYFNVHEATIRRDLSYLESLNKLCRTHGGVMIDVDVQSEPSFHERKSVQYEEKRRLGKLAAKYIEDGSNIILDSGTTTLHITDYIKDRKDLTVVTNDINIASQLRLTPGIKVIVTGGVLYPESFMLNGMITDSALEGLHVHTAFIGTPAFHFESGITHFDESLVPAKKAMIKAAKKVIVLTDHRKIGKISLHTVAKPNEIDILLTGKELDSKEKAKLNTMDVDVRLV